MYSIYDIEHKRYLYTGRNSITKGQAIQSLAGYLKPELCLELLTEPFWAQAEVFENFGYEFREHKYPIRD